MLYLSFDNSQEGALIGGEGTAVPEPDILALLALAGISLGFVHRRRVLGEVARECSGSRRSVSFLTTA
jgi:hypothetical protein